MAGEKQQQELSLPERPFPPGVRNELAIKTVKEYVAVVTVHNDIEIARWCLSVMGACTFAFLITWFVWGSGLLPNLTQEMVLWFGKGTIGVDAAGFATTVASRFKRTK